MPLAFFETDFSRLLATVNGIFPSVVVHEFVQSGRLQSEILLDLTAFRRPRHLPIETEIFP